LLQVPRRRRLPELEAVEEALLPDLAAPLEVLDDRPLLDRALGPILQNSILSGIFSDTLSSSNLFILILVFWTIILDFEAFKSNLRTLLQPLK
jgi:hypothetical protein